MLEYIHTQRQYLCITHSTYWQANIHAFGQYLHDTHCLQFISSFGAAFLVFSMQRYAWSIAILVASFYALLAFLLSTSRTWWRPTSNSARLLFFRLQLQDANCMLLCLLVSIQTVPSIWGSLVYTVPFTRVGRHRHTCLPFFLLIESWHQSTAHIHQYTKSSSTQLNTSTHTVSHVSCLSSIVIISLWSSCTSTL